MTHRIFLWVLVGLLGIAAWVFMYAANGYADIEEQKAQLYSVLLSQRRPILIQFGSTTATSTASSTRPRIIWGVASSTATNTASSTKPRIIKDWKGQVASTTATTTATTTRPVPRPGR